MGKTMNTHKFAELDQISPSTLNMLINVSSLCLQLITRQTILLALTCTVVPTLALNAAPGPHQEVTAHLGDQDR